MLSLSFQRSGLWKWKQRAALPVKRPQEKPEPRWRWGGRRVWKHSVGLFSRSFFFGGCWLAPLEGEGGAGAGTSGHEAWNWQQGDLN